MAINEISNSTSSAVYQSNSAASAKAANTTNAANTSKTSTTATDSSKVAASYEKSNSSASKKTTYKRDTALVEKMKADAEARSSSLRSLVEKMMVKQGQAFTKSTDIFSLLREGKLKVDPETAARAQKDIGEDGYWGVEQTSDRLVDFAKALSGGDPAKADELSKAIQKGFDQATKAWGSKLPDISQRTLEATMQKMEKWKNELTTQDY